MRGFRKIFLLLLLSFSFAPVLHVSAASVEELCGFSSLSEQEQTALTHLWSRAQSEGFFEEAGDAQIAEAEKAFQAAKSRKGGLKTEVDGEVGRVTAKDMDVDISKMEAPARGSLVNEGVTALAAKETKPEKALEGTPYKGFGSLLYFTSGAGLWSRGGGTVKALLPLNLKELVSGRQLEQLVDAGKIVAAKTPEDIAKMLSLETVPGPEKLKEIRSQAERTIKEITSTAMQNENAMNVLDLKLVNVAMLSQKTKSYIHFDVWTSHQTHEPIREYVQRFKNSYQNRRFHPDDKVNGKIQQALKDYFQASEQLGETHLFGYQEGYYPFDPNTGKSLRDKPAIGEGAGMAKHYLDRSGRSSLLQNRGVRDWVFQNIEVTSDIGLEYGAYRRAGKDVAAVMVPTQDGYAGGSPYTVTKDGKTRKQLLEGSAVDKELRSGNDFFNSNTIYQRLSLEPPKNVGYEEKDNGQNVRLKMNAGDITFEVDSALIGGRVKDEYENFKSYQDYEDNGQATIGRARDTWVSLLGG